MFSKSLRCVSLVLLVCLTASLFMVNKAKATIPFTSQGRFETPSGWICFHDGGSYEIAELENDSWHFQGLLSNNGNANATQSMIAVDSPLEDEFDDDSWLFSINYGNLSVSAVDSNVTIINYDLITPLVHTGWLNYTVQGKGTQTLNLYYNGSVFPISWTVQIDGEARPENNGWSISKDGLMTIAGADSDVEIRYEELQPPHEESPLPWTFREYLIFSVAVGSVVAATVVVAIFYFGGRQTRRKDTTAEKPARAE